MMPDRQVTLLRQILDVGCYESPAGNYQECHIRESAPNTTLKKVVVRHIGAQALVLYPEKGQGDARRYSQLLGTSQGLQHNRACDAVIYCSRNGKHYLILCELKSGRPKGAKEQFEATLCFLDYLDSILKRLHCCELPKRAVRRVVFNTERMTLQTLDKQPVRPGIPPVPLEDAIRFKCVSNGETVGIDQLL